MSKLDRTTSNTYHKDMLETNEVKGIKLPRNVLIIAGAVALVMFAAVAGYFTWQHFVVKKDSIAADKETVAAIVAEVGKIYDLPSDESPHVATLNDAGKLKDQEFYKKAQSGDYVLIYAKAQIAILYRQNDKKIINADHVTVGTQSDPNKTSDNKK